MATPLRTGQSRRVGLTNLEQTRHQLADRLRCLATEAEQIKRAVLRWADDVSLETDARLGIGPGEEHRDQRMADPEFNEALDRCDDLETLVTTIRSAAARFDAEGGGGRR
ncbi:MAG: hypothetical protein ACRDUA_25705 [Micromonosporaceae bacterium]